MLGSDDSLPPQIALRRIQFGAGAGAPGGLGGGGGTGDFKDELQLDEGATYAFGRVGTSRAATDEKFISVGVGDTVSSLHARIEIDAHGKAVIHAVQKTGAGLRVSLPRLAVNGADLDVEGDYSKRHILVHRDVVEVFGVSKTGIRTLVGKFEFVDMDAEAEEENMVSTQGCDELDGTYSYPATQDCDEDKDEEVKSNTATAEAALVNAKKKAAEAAESAKIAVAAAASANATAEATAKAANEQAVHSAAKAAEQAAKIAELESKIKQQEEAAAGAAADAGAKAASQRSRKRASNVARRKERKAVEDNAAIKAAVDLKMAGFKGKRLDKRLIREALTEQERHARHFLFKVKAGGSVARAAQEFKGNMRRAAGVAAARGKKVAKKAKMNQFMSKKAEKKKAMQRQKKKKYKRQVKAAAQGVGGGPRPSRHPRDRNAMRGALRQQGQPSRGKGKGRGQKRRRQGQDGQGQHGQGRRSKKSKFKHNPFKCKNRR